MYLLQTLGDVALYPGPGEEPASGPLLRGSKTLVVVAYVSQRPGRTASREHLAELFWPGRAAHGRRSLRQALYYLSRSGGEGILSADGSHVRFRPDLCSVDAERFEIALREGRFEEAAGLYEGPFLAGFDAGPCRELAHWIESIRERLEVGLRQALRESARTALLRGDVESAVAFGRRGARTFPLDDGIHELLLGALVRAGRPGEAVREYEAFRVLLREQLEDTPSGDLTAIAERAREAAAAGRPAVPDARPAGHAVGAESPAPGEPGPPEPGSPAGAAGPGDPHPPPLAGPGESPAPGARRAERRLLRLVAFVLLAVAAAWLVSVARGPRLGVPADASAGPGGEDPEVLLRVQTDATGFAIVAVRGDPPRSARVVATEERGTLLLSSPDGRFRARRIPTPNGPDIAIEDARTGEIAARVPNRDGRTPDDHIQGWSPDGRKLLFDSGLPTGDGSYDQRLFVFDVATRSVRAVSDRQLPPTRAAAWSPRGDAIVVVEFREGSDRADAPPRTDLFLVTPDGERIRRLTDDEAMEQAPTWAPDGRRIAFQRGPDGEGDIRVVEAGGGEPVSVAATAWSEETPVWLCDGWIAFTTDRGDGSEVWVVPASGDEARPLAEGLEVTQILQRLGPLGPVPWVESVTGTISAPGGALSPGEHARLEADLLASDSSRLHPADVPFAWRSLTPGRAELLGSSLLLVRDTGVVRLVADLRGWRADTLELRSLPLSIRGGPPALSETWVSGIDERTWRSVGDPAPRPADGVGPDGGGRLSSHGDANGESGVETRRAFSLDDGLTVEAWGRVPLTGAMYQTFAIALTREAGDPSTRIDMPPPDVAALRLMSTGLGASETAFLEDGDIRLGYPEPEGIDGWRRHALQVHPDGTLEWLIDGRRFASARRQRPLPGRVHVFLGGRSVGTEIEHGPVRIWEGIRYQPVRNLPPIEPYE